MRFDWGRIFQVVPQNTARAPASNSGSPSPAKARRTTPPSPGCGRSTRASSSGEADAGNTARKSPACRRRPSNPPKRPERHVERLPRMSATSIPPPIATMARAAPGAAASDTTSPSSRRSTLPGAGPNEPPTTARSRSPAARTTGPMSVISRAAEPSAFPTRRFARRRASSSSAPAAGTPKDAHPSRPRSCTVVRSPGSTTWRPRPVVTARSAPGRRARKGTGAKIEEPVRRAPEEIPASGRRRGIDPHVRPREGDAAGRHGDARRAATWQTERFRQAVEIGESRRETKESDGERELHEDLDEGVGEKAGERGDLVEILAVRRHRDLVRAQRDDGRGTKRSRLEGREPRRVQLRRADDEDRPGRGHDVHEARQTRPPDRRRRPARRLVRVRFVAFEREEPRELTRLLHATCSLRRRAKNTGMPSRTNSHDVTGCPHARYGRSRPGSFRLSAPTAASWVADVISSSVWRAPR